MSTKYHFNTKTGNPNICRAEKNCPFGGPEVHFATKDQARKGYEAGQNGSFEKPKKEERTVNNPNQLWTEEDDYSGAKLGTLVEFRDRTRFIKTSENTWETSAHGGFALDNEAMAAYPAQKGISAGSRIVKDEPEEQPEVKAEPTPRPKGTIKATTLQNASYEAGTEARRNFLLINHRDPEQLAAAVGKIKDQALVADIQRFNKLKGREQEIQKALRKATDNARNAKTQAQHDGYRKVMDAKAAELAALSPKVQEADDAIAAHGKRYAGQLVIHRRSLDSIERLANQGVKASPPKVKDRIYKLRKMQKDIPSVKDLRAKLEGSRPNLVLAAANEFGNPLYIKKAERFAAASEALNKMNTEAAALQRAHNSVSSPAVKATVEAEMLALQQRQGAVVSEFEKASEGLKLFSDDLKARFDQEQDVARELKALQRLSS